MSAPAPLATCSRATSRSSARPAVTAVPSRRSISSIGAVSRTVHVGIASVVTIASRSSRDRTVPAIANRTIPASR